MMGRLVAALLGCGLFCGPAMADDAAFRLAQVGGEASAFETLCPAMALDTKALASASVAAGVSETEMDWSSVRFFRDRTLEAWVGRSESDACAAADRLYGASGEMEKAILKRKS